MCYKSLWMNQDPNKNLTHLFMIRLDKLVERSTDLNKHTDKYRNKPEDKFGNGVNFDNEYNTEYGDGDIPEIDLPSPSNAVNSIPYEFPGKGGSGKK